MATFKGFMETSDSSKQESKRKEKSNRKISSKEPSNEMYEETYHKSSPQKTSKFSLSRIGKSHSFNIRRKAKENEAQIDQTKVVVEKSMYSPQSSSHRQRSKHRDDYSQYEESSSNKGRKSCQSYVISNAKDPRVTAMHKERQSSQVRVDYEDERRMHKRREQKRKERPNHKYIQLPSHLLNPPKILIEDFSSEYTDDMTFDNEYFELVEWAFHILTLKCNFQIQPQFHDVKIVDDDDDERAKLKMITNETARVGSTLDYILHPITTGAANVLQTGAKLADFTTRVWRGIQIVPRRNNQNSSDKT